MNIDNKNKSRQKHRLEIVSNKLLRGLNMFYARAVLALDSAVYGFCLFIYFHEQIPPSTLELWRHEHISYSKLSRCV